MEILWQRKGVKWNARGKCFKQAVNDVEQKAGLPRHLMAKQRMARCKELACEFLEGLQDDELMMLCADSGTKFRKVQEQGEVLHALSDELVRADQKAERCRLQELMDQAVTRWDILREHDLFSDRGEWQNKFIQREDYYSKVSGSLACFYACPFCGHYFSSKVWNKVGPYWYCWLNWDKWCELADPDDVKKVQEAWGTDLAIWPAVGCQKRYRPWKFGNWMAVECRTSEEEWKNFRADLIPEVLDDAIKKWQVEWNTAMAALPPSDIYDLIPRMYPKVNPVPLAVFDQFPGLGLFDIRQWNVEDQPILTRAGWLKLALKVAANDLENLQTVFNIATEELRLEGESF
jgi:hypothetical protein